jgi:hypothetical protein
MKMPDNPKCIRSGEDTGNSELFLSSLLLFYVLGSVFENTGIFPCISSYILRIMDMLLLEHC